jgi:hypothetical protein
LDEQKVNTEKSYAPLSTVVVLQLTAAEACHRLVPIEGQKENKPEKKEKQEDCKR